MKTCIECNQRFAAPKRRICYNCKSKRYETSHPLRVAYLRLKHHAKYRNKSFTLTFEQFAEFAQKVNYIAKKGRSAQSYHIDRRNELEGYDIDNIQLLTNRQNVLKYKQWYMNELGKSHFTIITNKTQESDIDQSCPF